MATLRVTSETRVKLLAVALEGFLSNGQTVQIEAIGPLAVNNAVKAIARVNEAFAPRRIVCIPLMVGMRTLKGECTGVKFDVLPP